MSLWGLSEGFFMKVDLRWNLKNHKDSERLKIGERQLQVEGTTSAKKWAKDFYFVWMNSEFICEGLCY